MRKHKLFRSWLDANSATPSNAQGMNWQQWRAERGREKRPNPATDQELRDAFWAEALASTRSAPKHVILDGWGTELKLDASKHKTDYLQEFAVTYNDSVKVKNLRTRRLVLKGCSEVSLTGLFVDTLELIECGDVHLKGCLVGTFCFREDHIAVRSLIMTGGAVLGFDCPVPGQRAPFKGSVHFDKSVFLPRAADDRLKGPQPYRNMRAHMLTLQNSPMANRFHSLEQAVERQMSSQGFDRMISLIYEVLSDYGASALRPLVCFLILLIFTTFILLTLDDAVIAGEVIGWQTNLLGDSWNARIARSVTLMLQSTFNPLGIFGPRNFIVAQSGILTLWLSVHGLFSAILIALFVLALRRRFKMA